MSWYAVRPIKTWPSDWKRDEPPTRYSPFSAKFTDTENLLARELSHLGATDVIVQLDIAFNALRLDGTLRANAREAEDPGVILSFVTKKFGALSYPCRAFCGGSYRGPGWQANLRAIALGLEALRKVERYGIAERGQQYAGFAELGSGIPLGPGVQRMTWDEAAKILLDGIGEDESFTSWVPDDLRNADLVTIAYRAAAKFHHPDVEGSDEVFKKIVQARDVLLEAADA